MNAPASKTLRDVAQSVVDWNTKYPSSRIYSEGEIRRIAAEMDVIFADAKEALRATIPPSDALLDRIREIVWDDVAPHHIVCALKDALRRPVTKEESR